MPSLKLDRSILSSIAQGNALAIKQLEKFFAEVDGLPATIEEASNLAGSSLALGQVNAALLAMLIDVVDQLDCAPAPAAPPEADDIAPRTHLGTMSCQNADLVEITGGAIDNTPIGSSTAAAAKVTTLAASGQITSTVAPGAPPLVIASTDLVANLYAARAKVADSASLGAPTTFPPAATDLPTAITLVNALRAAAINKGL